DEPSGGGQRRPQLAAAGLCVNSLPRLNSETISELSDTDCCLKHPKSSASTLVLALPLVRAPLAWGEQPQVSLLQHPPAPIHRDPPWCRVISQLGPALVLQREFPRPWGAAIGAD